MLSCLVLLAGCKGNEDNTWSSNLISLQERVSKLERLIIKDDHIIDSGEEVPQKLFIKSVTFRMDSKDDRLRIYWSDGRKTDLPCSKDEATWACG